MGNTPSAAVGDCCCTKLWRRCPREEDCTSIEQPFDCRERSLVPLADKYPRTVARNLALYRMEILYGDRDSLREGGATGPFAGSDPRQSLPRPKPRSKNTAVRDLIFGI